MLTVKKKVAPYNGARDMNVHINTSMSSCRAACVYIVFRKSLASLPTHFKVDSAVTDVVLIWSSQPLHFILILSRWRCDS